MKTRTVFAYIVAWSVVACAKTPELTGPADGAVVSRSIPSFRWKLDLPTPAANMPEFTIQLARDAAFKQRVDEDRMAAVVQWYVPAKALEPGTYWWRVGHGGDWSEPRSFEIRPAAREFRVKAGSGWAEIKQVFREASARTPARIVFDTAEYRLNPVAGDPVFLSFASVDDLTVDGNGSTVVLTKPVGLIRVEDCNRVMIENLTLDIDPPGYTAGTVLAIGKNTVDVEILPGHVLPDSDPVYLEDHGKGMLADPSEGYAIKRNVPLVVYHDGFESIGGRRFRFHFKKSESVKLFECGDLYVMGPRHLGRGANVAANVLGGEDVVFYNLTLLGAANECFGTYYSDRHAMINVQLRRKDGRVLTSNNGGHNHHNNRTGPWVENCLFENVGDDCMAINGLSMQMDSQPAPDYLIFDLRQPYDLRGVEAKPKFPDDRLDIRPGDRLRFFNTAAGRQLAEARVKSTEVDGMKLGVKLDRPLSGIQTGSIEPDASATYPAMNEGQTTHEVYNVDRMCNEFVFRNNIVRNGRRVGVLAKGIGGIVENNLFENMGGGGVEFLNLPFEGLAAENYVVRGNRIVDCGRVNRHDAGIWATIFTSGNDRLHRNILIEGNEITNFSGPGISLSDVEGGVVRNNTIQGCTEEIVLNNCLEVIKE